MIVDFRVHEISQGIDKLARISTLIKKKNSSHDNPFLQRKMNPISFLSLSNTNVYLLYKLHRPFQLGMRLFSRKQFSGNHFSNFSVFICHQKSQSTENTFQLKKNLAWFSGTCFFFYFGRKTLFRSCEKIRNVILFADYIKFSP